MKSLVCAAVLLILVLGCSAQNFVGTWTDPIESGGYGGYLHICQDGDKIYGAYSEAGIMYGTMKGNTIRGKWFEGGAFASNCYAGEFFLTLSDNGNIFYGWWTCGNKNPNLVRDTFPWGAQRVSVLRPNMYQCAKLLRTDLDDDDINSGITLEGLWHQEGVDNSHETRAVCLRNSGATYESSYEYKNRTGDIQVGIESGYVFFDAIGTGYSVEERKVGFSLMFLLADGSLGRFWWFAFQKENITPKDFSNPELHYYRIYTRGSDFERSDCQKAFEDSVQYLGAGYYLDDEDRFRSSSSASGSESIHTISPLLLVVVITFVLSTFI